MIKILTLALVGYIFYRALKSWMLGSGARPTNLNGQGRNEVDDVLVQDPVCKTYIAMRDSVHLRKGATLHYFCSEQCRDRYLQENPE